MELTTESTFPEASFKGMVDSKLYCHFYKLFGKTELYYINKFVDIINNNINASTNFSNLILGLYPDIGYENCFKIALNNQSCGYIYIRDSNNGYELKKGKKYKNVYKEFYDLAKEYLGYKQDKELIYRWMVINGDNLPSCITGAESSFTEDKYNLKEKIYFYLANNFL